MLTQFDDDGREFVVVYASRSSNKIQTKYSSYEGEHLAIDTPPLRDPNVGPRTKKKEG